MTPLEKAQTAKIIEGQLNATMVEVINVESQDRHERLELATAVVAFTLARHTKALGHEWLALVVEASIKAAAL